MIGAFHGSYGMGIGFRWYKGEEIAVQLGLQSGADGPQDNDVLDTWFLQACGRSPHE